MSVTEVLFLVSVHVVMVAIFMRHATHTVIGWCNTCACGLTKMGLIIFSIASMPSHIPCALGALSYVFGGIGHAPRKNIGINYQEKCIMFTLTKSFFKNF